ncbi:MAG: type II toxin-antitoxin system VapC family toxin [Actinomycetota bacterium]|nr:type II toxin-antitoxin system VapC family toxin [Actinomycetota bacterium]
MTHLLVDTSVLIKWFHGEGEGELPEARALRSAHVAGEIDAHVLDLAMYEVGNVLVRALRWNAAAAADQLDDLRAVVGPPLVMTAAWLQRAAALAQDHALSFYDASWAATASELGMPLVSADPRLLDAGLAESPSQIVSRLKLVPADGTPGNGVEGP